MYQSTDRFHTTLEMEGKGDSRQWVLSVFETNARPLAKLRRQKWRVLCLISFSRDESMKVISRVSRGILRVYEDKPVKEVAVQERLPLI